MNVISRTRPDAQETAFAWLKSFGDALQASDAAAAAAHFAVDGHWRDVLAFTWRLQTESGGAAIERALAPTLVAHPARQLPHSRRACRAAPRAPGRDRLHRGDLRVRDRIRPRQRRGSSCRGCRRRHLARLDAPDHARGAARLSGRPAARRERRRALLARFRWRELARPAPQGGCLHRPRSGRGGGGRRPGGARGRGPAQRAWRRHADRRSP